MKNVYLLLILPLFYSLPAQAQMRIAGKDLYGNEWIRYDQPYFKIAITADGMYRIPYETLAAVGVPVNATNASQYQLFHFGEEIPLYIPTDNTLTNGDYIEFYARKNRGALDQFLYKNGEADALNPEYSLFSDTAAYFLTIAAPGTLTQRFQAMENNLTNVPAKEAWFWREQYAVFANSVVQPRSAESYFERGEGFAKTVNAADSIKFKLNNPAFVAGAANSTFEIRLFSGTSGSNQIRVQIGTEISDQTIGSQQLQTLNIPKTTLAPNEEMMLSARAGSAHIAYVRYRYPQAFNFEGKTAYFFKLGATQTGQYLEIENFNTSNANPILYDLTNKTRYIGKVENGKVRIQLPASLREREFMLVNAVSGASIVNTLTRRQFVNYSTQNAEFLLIANSKLYKEEAGSNWVKEYADYRSQTYKTTLADIDQLYDQFAYGVARHPLAIRNFAFFAKNKEQWNLKYVFLIGKALHYNEVRTNAALAESKFFVPTFGTLGSDYLLLASHDSQVPLVPIGRLAATKPEQIKWYLEKVKQHEKPTNQDVDRAWRKQILHLGGGVSTSEQNSFKNTLNNLGTLVQNNAFGANITSIFKKSLEPIQTAESEVIARLLNEGVSVLTYLGHAGFEGFEFSMDAPSTFQNQGKYHTVFALGCYTGNIHTNANTSSASESYIFQKERGAIAFLSTVSQGSANTLQILQQEIYNQMGGNFYGKGIGEVMRACIQNLDNRTGMRNLLQQFSLHGDPSVVITPGETPDYKVDAKSVQFNPAFIDAQQPDFDLKFSVLNIGKAVNQNLSLKITRELPDQSKITVLETTLLAPKYKSDLSYRFPVLGANTAGKNRIYIELDTKNEIAEKPTPEAEANNDLVNSFGERGAPLYIFSNSVKPVYPPDFGIVSNHKITLKAFTSNINAPAQPYFIEIDTTAYFNSPLQRASNKIVQKGGLIQWTPDLPMQDSVTYYWRVTADSTSGFGYLWSNSSFTYLPQSPSGWNQSHFFQWRSDSLSTLQITESTRRRFQYQDDIRKIEANIFAAQATNGRLNYNLIPGLSFGNEYIVFTPYNSRDGRGFVRNGVYIAVIDRNTGRLEYNDLTGKGGSVPPNYGAAGFPFWTTDKDWRTKVINFLQNEVSDGNYVILFTIQTIDTLAGGIVTSGYEPEEWAADSLSAGDKNLFNFLEDQGATRVRTTATSGAVPYLLMYRKNDRSFTPIERVGELTGAIQDSFYLPLSWYTGKITSTTVGPAKKWSSIHWKATPSDEYDELKFDVYGIRADSSTSLLIPDLKGATADLSNIKPSEYPYLQLQFSSTDNTLRTPPQLNHWRVLYDGLPDGVLSPGLHFESAKDTIQQGEPFYLEVAIANASDYPMENLSVKYTLTDESNKGFQLLQPLPLLRAQDTIWARLELPADTTRQLTGKQQLLVEVNPNKNPQELNYLNNVGIFNFFAEKDQRNPLLEVTFDGIHIMDGDLVSAKPFITIRLQDENQFLLLKDAAVLALSLKHEDEETAQNIPIDGTILKFFPASENNKTNRATLEWEPTFTKDGVYKLTVQAQDVTGNLAGKIKYETNFEVITASNISNVLNYPNPFSTSTQFVYTLTGDEPPLDYKIQIMTVSGRIIRELTRADLGDLRIGTHRTERAWDGTDAYGNRLANGVYLYRVIIKDKNGDDLGKYSSESNNIDRFFKNNIGKLVILR